MTRLIIPTLVMISVTAARGNPPEDEKSTSWFIETGIKGGFTQGASPFNPMALPYLKGFHSWGSGSITGGYTAGINRIITDGLGSYGNLIRHDLNVTLSFMPSAPWRIALTGEAALSDSFGYRHFAGGLDLFHENGKFTTSLSVFYQNTAYRFNGRDHLGDDVSGTLGLDIETGKGTTATVAYHGSFLKEHLLPLDYQSHQIRGGALLPLAQGLYFSGSAGIGLDSSLYFIIAGDVSLLYKPLPFLRIAIIYTGSGNLPLAGGTSGGLDRTTGAYYSHLLLMKISVRFGK